MSKEGCKVVSWNAGKSLGDEVAWSMLFQLLDEFIAEWDIVFVPECDGHLGDRDICMEEPYLAYRHWPGAGSFPMAVVSHHRIQRYVRRIEFRGRCGRVHVSDFQNVNACFIFIQTSHGDNLPESLADAAFLAHGRPRGSTMAIMGDWNIDILPVRFCDPFADEANRQQHHAHKRMLLESFCDALSLNVFEPHRLEGVPPEPWHEAVLSQALLSRVPIGRQHGLPSCLDYVVAQQGCVTDIFLCWSIEGSDHAYPYRQTTKNHRDDYGGLGGAAQKWSARSG